jgi:hypothetical protein
MSTGNPIDDILKSVDDLAKSADDFWTAFLKNHYGIAELMTNLALNAVFTGIRYNAIMWLQKEYFRSLKEPEPK